MDSYKCPHAGRTVVMRGWRFGNLLFILKGYNSDPSCRLSDDYKAPEPPPHPGFRSALTDPQIREMVREELKATLQGGNDEAAQSRSDSHSVDVEFSMTPQWANEHRPP